MKSLQRASGILRVNLVAISAVLGILSLTGCFQGTGKIEPATRYVSVERPARVPAGVVRYCWEEPIVDFESNGPGVDVDGRWYHPSYLAVREVRQGRWRPCRPVPNEVDGETRNER